MSNLYSLFPSCCSQRTSPSAGEKIFFPFFFPSLQFAYIYHPMCISRSQENLIKNFCGSLWTQSDQRSQKATDISEERVLCGSLISSSYTCTKLHPCPTTRPRFFMVTFAFITVARHHVASQHKSQVEKNKLFREKSRPDLHISILQNKRLRIRTLCVHVAKTSTVAENVTQASICF